MRGVVTGLTLACAWRAACAFAQPAPPYPPSESIEAVTWRFDEAVQFGPGSDQWPMTWADDDDVYAAWGDGWGWDRDQRKFSIGVTRVSGEPPRLVGVDLWGIGPGSGFAKPEALVAFDQRLFMFWTKGDSKGDTDDTHTAVSADNGQTWSLGATKALVDGPPGFRVRGICQFGRGYAGAIDEFVYIYFAFSRASEIYLARVERGSLFDSAAYAWFSGLSNLREAIWTSDFAAKRPAFVDANGFIWHIGVSYNAGIQRFLLTKPHYCADDDRSAGDAAHTRVASFGMFDAPTPWGPWTTVAYEDNFKDSHVKFSYFLPTKYMSQDGLGLWLAWSGWPEYDNVNFVPGTLRLRAAESP